MSNAAIQTDLSPLIDFSQEPLNDALYLELEPLLIREWEEVGFRKDVLKLDLDLVAFDALARVGRLAIFTVRISGALTGYIIYTLGHHPKYKTTSWATMAGWWIVPEMRKPTVSMRLLQYSVEWLKRCKIEFILGAYRVDHPAAGRLLEAEGFVPYEVGCLKVLVGGN